MLRSAHRLAGCRVLARNGPIGALAQLYFDDARWAIRYLAVDTCWSESVLIAPLWVEHVDRRTVALSLSEAQIVEAPRIDTFGRTTTRDGRSRGRASAESGAFAGPFCDETACERCTVGFGRLRGTEEVVGYGVDALDGEVGCVDDLLFDDSAWALRYFVIDGSTPRASVSALASIGSVLAIARRRRRVATALTRCEVTAGAG